MIAKLPQRDFLKSKVMGKLLNFSYILKSIGDIICSKLLFTFVQQVVSAVAQDRVDGVGRHHRDYPLQDPNVVPRDAYVPVELKHIFYMISMCQVHIL